MAELTLLGESEIIEYWKEKIRRITPRPEILAQRAVEERAKEELRRESCLEEFLYCQVGKGYFQCHQGESLDCWKTIRSHIYHLLKTGVGACYSGGTGTGKTHTLLDYMLTILRYTWGEAVKEGRYPALYPLFEKTTQFWYSVQLIETLQTRARIPFARYNLIDDLGVESMSPYAQSKLDEYVEEINRRDLCLIVSTNLSKGDLSKIVMYRRIFSRIQGRCRFFELPPGDLRDPEVRKRRGL